MALLIRLYLILKDENLFDEYINYIPNKKGTNQ